MMTTTFTLSWQRLFAVAALVRQARPNTTDVQVEETLTHATLDVTDTEHQTWLDTAPVDELAAWYLAVVPADAINPNWWNALPCGVSVRAEDGQPVRVSDCELGEDTPDEATIVAEIEALFGVRVRLGLWSATESADATAEVVVFDDDDAWLQWERLLHGDDDDNA